MVLVPKKTLSQSYLALLRIVLSISVNLIIIFHQGAVCCLLCSFCHISRLHHMENNPYQNHREMRYILVQCTVQSLVCYPQMLLSKSVKNTQREEVSQGFGRSLYIRPHISPPFQILNYHCYQILVGFVSYVKQIGVLQYIFQECDHPHISRANQCFYQDSCKSIGKAFFVLST